MTKLLANSGDSDQMLYFMAYDLGLHCLQIMLLGISRLKWVNIQDKTGLVVSLVWLCP